ncbi:hypothetical protein A2V54_00255 [candidate division WWE3 bacterium RBG_19FT_COMBO_53_11]|uniref:Uncharacterized protein n=1 Tax=candidate division WWE3 bacterium RBG_19FT_COMBO_53_11 TaxID=1802613 RepID=A0A1F4UHP2_UNCKA|nr:MAG: hypothetical protein A2V54_00255 [candidate division WWE3 bacterium RBG_19FT_COMBO_53_11]
MKKAVFVLALVAVGLLLVGCGPEKVVQPPADQQELEVSFSTPNGRATAITIFYAGGAEEILADRVLWYYDVPNDLREYAVISYDVAGLPHAELHLLESKQPSTER